MSAQHVPGERELEPHVPQVSFLDRLAERLDRAVGTHSVFGSPVERDGVTVIPVAKARWGMGGGSGQRRSGPELRHHPGVGGGGGAVVKPVGFIELANGRTRFRTIPDAGVIAFAVVAGGFFSLAMLRTALGARRASSRTRIRLGRKRRIRRIRRLFR